MRTKFAKALLIGSMSTAALFGASCATAATAESTKAAEELLKTPSYQELLEKYIVAKIPHSEAVDDFAVMFRGSVVKNLANEFSAEELAKVAELAGLLKAGAPAESLKDYEALGKRLTKVVFQVQADVAYWAVERGLYNS